ncbi:MAG: paraquat-inducible protein A [Pseudomonadota bacterium]
MTEPSASPDETTKLDPSTLIGCPNCDQVYHVREVKTGERATCHRCHTVLIAPRATALTQVLAFTLANLVLVVAAVFYPFLEISAAGIVNAVSLLDVATSFRSGTLVAVSVASVAMIVLVPLTRMILVFYVVAPLAMDRRPGAYAATAFRVAQELKPWAMTEIFIIGCAVALVKVADLAQLQFGIAFWMFIALSIFVVFVDRTLCDWSIWSALERRGHRKAPKVSA